MRKLLAIAMLVIAGISLYLLIFTIANLPPLRHSQIAIASFVMFFAANLLIVVGLLLIGLRLLRGVARSSYQARWFFAAEVLYFVMVIAGMWITLPQVADAQTRRAMWTGAAADLPFSVQLITGFPLIGLILS